MDALIQPTHLEGTVHAVASKSQAHRMLILAALGNATCDISCNTSSEDIDATIRCLTALGARVARTRLGFRVVPLRRALPRLRGPFVLDCGESGSTLRFMLPVVCALGVSARFMVRGRLAERPLGELRAALIDHGCTLSAEGDWPLETAGRLQAGDFDLPGNVSSQYVTGLLLAASLLDAPSRIHVSEPVESAPYIRLTIDALACFGVSVEVAHETRGGIPCLCYTLDPEASPLATPSSCAVEGDWSNAAFWLAAGAISGGPICVEGLNLESSQGDRQILAALALFGARLRRSGTSVTVSAGRLRPLTLDISDIPDLVPPLAAVCACAEGSSRLTGGGRLRLKESDRLQSVSDALQALGVSCRIEGDDLIIQGVEAPAGGMASAAGDHRIAMMASVLASVADGPSTIVGAECVSKSYPGFYDDFSQLGGRATLSAADATPAGASPAAARSGRTSPAGTPSGSTSPTSPSTRREA
jgi:3-phosphoshikimate 1-carboxyvinyltransferase